MSQLKAEGGIEVLLGLLQSHAMSEVALLAMQVLVAAGEKPRRTARALDNAGAAHTAAQVCAMRALDRLSRPLAKKRQADEVEGMTAE